jgi:DNA-binding NtrC family response regulator
MLGTSIALCGYLKDLGKVIMENHPIILIATPEPLTRQELLGRLSDQGYQAIAVERGSDALLGIAEENVSLVILDSSVQEPSGIKTVEILRKMRPRLPVIVLSADHSVEAGREILQHGVFYYFVKPLDLAELDQIVRIALAPNKQLRGMRDHGALATRLGEETGEEA